MIRASHHFPRGFLWGTATSSHQVEGANTNNDWWSWEQEQGHIQEGHRSGNACDWWGGRWREDLDRAEQGGQNAHRLSVEWSRVEPTPALWDEDALDHYRQIVRGILDRGMLPIVTLHHFTQPLWVAERGGWLYPEIVSLFQRYVRKVVGVLEEFVGLWVTINEPNVLFYNGYVEGVWPPGERDLSLVPRVIKNLLKAHAAAYRTLHEIQPGALVGLAHHYRGFQAMNPGNPLDNALAALKHNSFNQVFPRACKDGQLRFLFW